LEENRSRVIGLRSRLGGANSWLRHWWLSDAVKQSAVWSVN